MSLSLPPSRFGSDRAIATEAQRLAVELAKRKEEAPEGTLHIDAVLSEESQRQLARAQERREWRGQKASHRGPR